MLRAMAHALFTIGYQDADPAALIAALQRAGVTLLLDIRDAPVSRKPGFSKRALAEATQAAGIGYRHLRGLGNPKPGRDAARAGDLAAYHRIFAAQLDSAAGRAELATAAALAAAQPACLLCFERDPAHCHRAIVAARLAESGHFTVRDLFAGPAA